MLVSIYNLIKLVFKYDAKNLHFSVRKDAYKKSIWYTCINQAKSFFELGYDVTLVYPKTNNQQTIYESLSDYYQEDFQFKVSEVDFLTLHLRIYINYFQTFKKCLCGLHHHVFGL